MHPQAYFPQKLELNFFFQNPLPGLTKKISPALDQDQEQGYESSSCACVCI